MLTYVIRRLLYSIVVLVAASMLVFIFVAKSGDPLAALEIAPNVSQVTVQNIRERKHLDDPDLRAVLLLGHGRVHEQVRDDAARRTSRSCPTSGAR